MATAVIEVHQCIVCLEKGSMLWTRCEKSVWSSLSLSSDQ